jgi:hypothetical protein
MGSRSVVAGMVALAMLAASPARAATRGECEAALADLAAKGPDVKPRFMRKFKQQRELALQAQKKGDWDGCAAAAAEALTPGRPTPPAPR